MTTNPCNTRGPIMADMFFRSYQQLTFMNWQACHMLRCFCWSLPNSTLETGSCSLGTIAPWYCRKIEQIMPSPFGLPERSLIWHPLRRPRVRVSSPVSGEISKACLAFGCPAPSPPATRSPPRGCAPCCGPRRSVAEPSSHGGSVLSFLAHAAALQDVVLVVPVWMIWRRSSLGEDWPCFCTAVRSWA